MCWIRRGLYIYIYAKLRALYLKTACTIEDLVSVLQKYSISISSQAATHLFVRMQLEIEAHEEFVPAMGREKHPGSQEP